jgi:hypothetical protein
LSRVPSPFARMRWTCSTNPPFGAFQPEISRMKKTKRGLYV